ncbi:MAG: TIGR03936 family radical SAM-associated protein [Candidatus Omnitrophica bacterium]|nr:TIGR03936 family radical SAM-associated protein [Candidatus Omnitrophota bacterium]MCK5287606.1 TIGR03936 family radical SAM-associated protein [Candidatus Omnitrophota bacterium]MCK5392891.1 TIGR03936 family radical SAM-associated protein [Candidatus Omnitrophota bacterium]MCK5493183.1 TIGR03936 family radical SAM-associated protein [Candidatus Omnitrophota bacterium]
MNITKYPLEITLYKNKEMIYYSQQDIFHILERALRRSNLPLYFTQGFNPRVKISFLDGLKLGIEGKIKTILYFTENIALDKLKEYLDIQLPEGLEILT